MKCLLFMLKPCNEIALLKNRFHLNWGVHIWTSRFQGYQKERKPITPATGELSPLQLLAATFCVTIPLTAQHRFVPLLNPFRPSVPDMSKLSVAFCVRFD